MTRLIRLLAVVALALSPVWGVQTVVAASSSAPAHYPVWPSFLSTGCTALQGPGGSTSVSCGGGSFLLSQINSGYACNEVDISVSSFQQGSFLVVGTVNSGSQSNTVQIDGPGDYFMQFPGFLTNNLVTLQMTSGSNGSSMTIEGITSSACPVATATNSPNPSDTATNTPVPVTGTPTAIPTHTPLPSGHSTFTPSRTPTGSPVPATATVTATPGPSEFNCGSPSFPLLNCNFIGAVNRTVPPNQWDYPNSNANNSLCAPAGGSNAYPLVDMPAGANGYACRQSVTAQADGNLYVQYQYTFQGGNKNLDIGLLSQTITVNSISGSCPAGGTNYCIIAPATGLISGNTYDFGVFFSGGSTETFPYLIINDTWIQASGTLTPAVPTFTPVPSSTPGPPGTDTVTPTPSNTDIPIPGAMSTNIPTATECPGSCVVTALTAIPGMATRTMVDTSPFSALTHLSMARSSCAPFGYVQIPYPVITGTPVMGQPLNFGWTVPVTHTWDNTNPLSNTAIQPCAMSEIPSGLWDFTYWFSVFGIATVFIMWLIGLVGRLSGEETING